MDHFAPQRGPMTPQERWFSAVFLIFLFGLFAAEIVHDFAPAKLAAFLIVLFWVPLLALHEAGHALVAYLVGWSVGQVVIGMGRTVGEFRVGSAVVEIRLIPVEGFVRSVPCNLSFPRVKNAFIYFAGPGIELAAAALVLFAVGPDVLLRPSENLLVITCQSFVAAATVQAVLNLMPFPVQTPEGRIVSDGLGIIESFLRPESYYAAMAGQKFHPEEREWQNRDPADWWKRNGSQL